VVLAILAALCILAYLPTLRQPLLEDDYPNLAQSQQYGAPGEVQELMGSVFRLRATSEWLFYAMYRNFGVDPAPYYCVAIALHVLCTWLVYALGFWPAVGYRVSGWAAGFFAVYEGHQEAVMWFSACNELLQFLFGATALVCWLHFLWGERGRWWWYSGSLACFAAALISKESAAVFAALMFLPVAHRRRAWAALAPFFVLAASAAISVYLSRDNSFRFQDGSFSLHAPFWRTLPLNYWRLFWFWGLVALMVARQRAYLGLIWAGIGLLPYVFLTYSAQIPSRQLYLASAGLALVVGAAMAGLRARRAVIAAICCVVVAENGGYLWIKKRRQFLERAAPTEQLIAYAKQCEGPVTIRCFPRARLIAEDAVRLGASKTDVIWNENAGEGFCYRGKY